MPTKLPRINVTLHQPVYDLIRRLSELNGHSMSHVVSDLLTTIFPPMCRTVALLEAAEESDWQTKESVRRAALQIERELSTAANCDQVELLTFRGPGIYSHPISRVSPLGSTDSPPAPRSGKGGNRGDLNPHTLIGGSAFTETNNIKGLRISKKRGKNG